MRSQAGISDVAVAGLTDPNLGQAVVAAFVLADHAADTAVSDAINAIKTKLADYKVPERVAVVREIPRTASGKTDRVSVAKLFANDG